MFEKLEDAEVCIWEEAEKHQEAIKLITEGAETSVAAKYRKNVNISRAVLGITCNVIPWITIRANEQRKAFGDRCLLYMCAEMPQLIEYANHGRINPKAWLYVDTNTGDNKKVRGNNVHY